MRRSIVIREFVAVADFTCIYCKAVLPKSGASRSHIIPASLGGRIELAGAVCKPCNGKCAIEFEDIFKDSWAWLLLWMEIKGRGNKSAPLKATVEFGGQTLPVTIRSKKSPPDIPPAIKKNVAGKDNVQFLGSDEYVERKKAEWMRKHRDVKWTEKKGPKVEFRFPINVDGLNSSASRRLAAKVAFEFWGSKRIPKTLLGGEFETIREFIKTGNETAYSPCGLLADQTLIRRNLKIPIPHHAVLYVIHPSSSLLGAIVVFFGMFYYWVILDSEYPFATSMSELTIITPMNKEPHEPVIIGSGKFPRIPWEQICKPDPDCEEKAWKIALRKFEEFNEKR